MKKYLKRKLKNRLLNVFIFLGLSCLQIVSVQLASIPLASAQSTSAQQKTVRHENYKSAKQWAEPRLQYTRFEENGALNVWSSKTDGSDERLVFAFSKFKPEEGYLGPYTPVRSPDNRYLMISLETNKGWRYGRALVNLPAQTYEIVNEGQSRSAFNWGADSKRVIFKSYSDVKIYNLATEEFADLPYDTHYDIFIPYDRTYLLNDQKTLLTVLSHELVMHDIKSGEEVGQRVNLQPILKISPKAPWQITDTDLSPDNEHLYFRNIHGTGVFNLKTGKPLYFTQDREEPEESYMHRAIFMNNKELIYAYKKSLYVVDIYTQKRRKVSLTDFNGQHMTLINQQKIQ